MSPTSILILVLLIASVACAVAAPSTVGPVWSGVPVIDKATVSNAMACEVRKPGRCAGVSRDAVFLHPKDNGDATATWHVSLPKLAPGDRLVLSTWIGISDGALADLRWRIDGDQVVIQGPLPAVAITTVGKLETGLTDWLPEYRVMEAGSSRIVLGPVTDDVSEARAIAADTDGLVLTSENPEPPYAIPAEIPVLTLEDLR